MTPKSKKEIIILAVLIFLLSISLFSQFSKDIETSPNPKIRRTAVPTNAVSNEVLKVDLLKSETPEFSGVKRNIFQFGSVGKSVGSQEKLVPFAPPQQIGTSAPTIPEVHYLGFYYEKDTGLKMASLSNSGRIHVGKIGQVLGGKYQVQEIAADHVILKLLLQEGKYIRVPLGRAPATYVEAMDPKK